MHLCAFLLACRQFSVHTLNVTTKLLKYSVEFKEFMKCR